MPTPTFSRRHYIKIAAEISLTRKVLRGEYKSTTAIQVSEYALDTLVCNLASEFEQDTPAFSRSRFLAASEYPVSK